MNNCNCSRERIEKGLISIGKEEILSIINEDGKADIICNFCGKEYKFSREDLENLLKKIEVD